MTLRHIEIFVTVCQENSITYAAERLHISQPTVSVAIREMEEHYGERLFDRLSRRLHITPFGQTIYDYALQLLTLYTDISNINNNINCLRIGTGTAIGKLFMPTIVKSFTNLYPDVKISICVGDATRMYHRTLENSLDLVFAETVDNIPGLRHRIIQHFPVVAIQHKSLSLAQKQVVTAADLAKEPLLLRETGSSTRDVVDAYFNSHNLSVTPMWEGYSVQSLLNATVEGLGVCFLSLDHVLAYGNPDLVILNTPDFYAERCVNVCFHKNKVFTSLMQNFLSHFLSCTRTMLLNSMEAYRKQHPDSAYTLPQL